MKNRSKQRAIKIEFLVAIESERNYFAFKKFIIN